MIVWNGTKAGDKNGSLTGKLEAYPQPMRLEHVIYSATALWSLAVTCVMLARY